MSYTLFDDRNYADLPNTMRDKVDKYKVEDSYKTIPYIYAANNVIGNSISGVELKFYTVSPRDSEKMRRLMRYKHKSTIKSIKQFQYNRKQAIDDMSSYQEIPVTHEVYNIFNPPSSLYNSMSEFNFVTWVLMGLFGEAFWGFEFGENGNATKPTGVFVQSPYYVTERVDYASGKLLGWEIQSGGDYALGTSVYAPERVIQFKYPNPYNNYRGLSPLLAGRLTGEEYTNMKIANAMYFANGFKSNIAWKLDRNFTNADERQKTTRVLNSMYNTFTKRNQALVLGKNESVDKLFDSNDLDYIKGFELNLGEIAAIYQVPKLFLQETGSTNYNTSQTEKKSLWENCLLPKLQLQKQAIQNQLLNKYFPNVFVEWDYSSIDTLRDDPIEIIDYKFKESGTVLNYLAAGYSRPEIADLLDNEKLNPENSNTSNVVEGDYEDIIEIEETPEDVELIEGENNKLIKFSHFNRPIIQTDYNEVGYTTSFENNKKLITLKLTDAFLTDYQDKYERYVLTPLENQYKGYIESYLKTAINSLTRQVNNNAIYPHLNPSEWDNMWTDLSYNLVEQTFKTAVTKTSSELKNPKKILRYIRVKQENIIEQLFGTANWEIMLESIGAINKKTVGFSQRAISNLNMMMSSYISQGLTITKIRKNLDEQKDLIFASNSTTVARTVTGVAYNTARHQAMWLSGVKTRSWASSLDTHTRQDHLRQHTSLQAVKWGQKYRYTNLLYPQEPGGAANQIINCRCNEVASSFYENPNIHNTLIGL